MHTETIPIQQSNAYSRTYYGSALEPDECAFFGHWRLGDITATSASQGDLAHGAFAIGQVRRHQQLALDTDLLTVIP